MPYIRVSVSVGLNLTLQLHTQADVDIGTAAHGALDPDGSWLHWADFANKVFHFWRLVGPSLRERPDEEPR
eukprot:5917911-Amphidinium_carterae.1